MPFPTLAPFNDSDSIRTDMATVDARLVALSTKLGEGTTDTLYVDQANERVGIRTGSPAHRLHIAGAGVAVKDIYIAHTLGNGSGLASTYRPIDAECFYTATDIANPFTLAWSGVRSGVQYGNGGVAAVGTAHALTADMIVAGNGNASNEHAGLAITHRYDIGTGYAQTAGPSGRAWLMDLGLHGPIGVQPGLLNGITQLVNNHYNGSPSAGASAALWLVTRQGSGTGIDATHDAAATYPVDVGLGIAGQSSAGANLIGFTVGIQLGGFASGGSGWGVTASKFDVGLKVRDVVTAAADLGGPLIFTADNAHDVGASASGRPRNLFVGTALFAGGLVQGQAFRASGDPGSGVSNLTIYTNGQNTATARSTGVGTIKFADATARDNAGFIKIWVGTTAYHIPVFAAN